MLRAKLILATTITGVASLALADNFIAVDTPITAAIVHAALGADVTIITLLDPADDDHHFHIDPATAKAITEAKEVVILGNGFNAGLEASVRNLRGDQRYQLIGCADYKPDCTAESDPHFWLDPMLVARAVETLAARYDNEPRASRVTFAWSLGQDFHYLSDHRFLDHLVAGSGINYLGALRDADDNPLPPRDLAALHTAIGATPPDRLCLVYNNTEPSTPADYDLDPATSSVGIDLLGWQITPDNDFFDNYYRTLAAALRGCAAP